MIMAAQLLQDFGTELTPRLEGLGALAKIACLSLAAGVGPFLYFVPARLRSSFLGVTLLLTLGLGIILVAAVYCLSLGLTLASAVPGSMGFSLGCVAYGLRRPSDLRERVAASIGALARWKYHTAAALVIPLVVVSPGAHRGLTQPLRIGVDQMGYAITGQYLLEGGSLESLRGDVLAQTGKANLDEALASNSAALCVNTNIASEFLLKSQRWYPAGIAATLSSLGERYVLPIQFLFLYFPLVLMFGASYHFLRQLTGVSDGLSVLGAAAVVMNVNLLNNLCEGQHAQVFGGPFFFLLLSQLFYFRNGSSVSTTGQHGSRAPEYAFTCLLAGMVVCSFPELLLLTAILTGLVWFLDLVCCRRVWHASLFRFGVAVAGGVALAGPYGLGLPAFYCSHLKHLQTGGGFWQPQWAWPAEILGLFNIYTSPVAAYIGRGKTGGFTVLCFSILCVELVVLRLFARMKVDISFWLAPVVFVMAVFVKVYYVNHLHNYQYMKAYTLVMLPFMALFFGACYALLRARVIGRVLLGGCMLWIVALGGLYLVRYTKEATYTSCSMARLARLKGDVNWDDYVWITRSPRIDKLVYGSLVRFNWLNLGWEVPYLEPHIGKKIGIWCEPKELDGQCLEDTVTTLYRDSELVLLDSGWTLGSDQLMVEAAGAPLDKSARMKQLVGFTMALLRASGLN
jgi:hypothetical protein